MENSKSLGLRKIVIQTLTPNQLNNVRGGNDNSENTNDPETRDNGS